MHSEEDVTLLDEQDPPVLDKITQAEITFIFERVPHVTAYCFNADGVLLPYGYGPQKCSPSCHDHRVLVATTLHDAGIRPPIQIPTFLKAILPGQKNLTAIGSVMSAGPSTLLVHRPPPFSASPAERGGDTEIPDSGEMDHPPSTPSS